MLALVVGLSACGSEAERQVQATTDRDRPAAVSVSPVRGGPRTTFVLKARNPRSEHADYGLRLEGPGGRSCAVRLSARFVLEARSTPLTTRRGYERRYLPPQLQDPLTPSVARGYDPRAQGAPWRPGTYRLAVRQVDKLRKRPSSAVGTVTLTVGTSGGGTRGPRRPSHGVSEAGIDKSISETPY